MSGSVPGDGHDAGQSRMLCACQLRPSSSSARVPPAGVGSSWPLRPRLPSSLRGKRPSACPSALGRWVRLSTGSPRALPAQPGGWEPICPREVSVVPLFGGGPLAQWGGCGVGQDKMRQDGMRRGGTGRDGMGSPTPAGRQLQCCWGCSVGWQRLDADPGSSGARPGPEWGLSLPSFLLHPPAPSTSAQDKLGVWLGTGAETGAVGRPERGLQCGRGRTGEGTAGKKQPLLRWAAAALGSVGLRIGPNQPSWAQLPTRRLKGAKTPCPGSTGFLGRWVLGLVSPSCPWGRGRWRVSVPGAPACPRAGGCGPPCKGQQGG